MTSYSAFLRSRLTCASGMKNLLRKTNHWNHDYYRALGEYEFTNEDYFLRMHAGGVPSFRD